ncbi:MULTISPECIES: hypothetical protein [Streptomyces]|uniref:hypothetical protein n=1 Tax=Streptomyces TaxID=1883 RepID=UPI000F740B3D|nr:MULTISPECIES: hypothetical protein [Streptomyces]MCM3262488.1 hypothetical protein [Streptomyces thermoviolaceus]RSS02384.1 hypothetical protein EF917_14685 [Streptomyces sp. WAC00469]
MTFTPTEAQFDCTGLVTGSRDGRERALDDLAAAAVDVIHRTGFAVFRIGRLRLGVEESRRLSTALVERIRTALIARGTPAGMRLEIDRPQQTYVPEGFTTRTLLPHHDGQHCSYLTPSLVDAPDWDPAWREFGSSGYTTTPAHKMYQGIFLRDVGEGLSVTTYYDWLGIIDDVLDRRGLHTQDDRPATAARWIGDNLRRAVERRPEHGCAYPSFGAMLGLEEPWWHGLSFHHGEATLTKEERVRYPAAVPLAQRCACGACEGEAARLFCHQVLMATGWTWSQFRRRWEVLAPGEQCDLLFGHNLTMLHGGLAGGPGRVIEPLCLVMDDPAGPDYERWLAASWRRRLPGAP